jgi:hypothetical protein
MEKILKHVVMMMSDFAARSLGSTIDFDAKGKIQQGGGSLP